MCVLAAICFKAADIINYCVYFETNIGLQQQQAAEGLFVKVKIRSLARWFVLALLVWQIRRWRNDRTERLVSFWWALLLYYFARSLVAFGKR